MVARMKDMGLNQLWHNKLPVIENALILAASEKGTFPYLHVGAPQHLWYTHIPIAAILGSFGSYP